MELNNIAEKIIKRDVMDFNTNPLFRDRKRGTLYNHTSDGTYYKGEIGEEKDIFYLVAGIGKGHWGLRNYEHNGKTFLFGGKTKSSLRKILLPASTVAKSSRIEREAESR